MKKRIEKMASMQAAAGGLCLAAALALLTVRLAAGYVGEKELYGAGEAAMYVFVWGVFLESGALVYEKRHFAFGALKNALKSRRAEHSLALFDCLVKLAFSAMAVFYGVCLAVEMAKGGETYGLERGFLWLCLPFCAATSAVYLSFQLWEELEGGRGKEKEGDGRIGAEGPGGSAARQGAAKKHAGSKEGGNER